MPSIFTNNGYIVSIVHDGGTSEAYPRIEEAMRARPTAPVGYDYRLTTSMEWELYRLPEPEREDEETATEADYLASLAELGVE